MFKAAKNRFKALIALVLLAVSSQAQAKSLPRFTWKQAGWAGLASLGAYWAYNKYGKSFTCKRFDVKKEVGLQLEEITKKWRTDKNSPEYQEIQAALKADKEILIAREFTTFKRVIHCPNRQHIGSSRGSSEDHDQYPNEPVLIFDKARNVAWTDTREVKLDITRGMFWDEYTLKTTITWKRMPAAEAAQAEFMNTVQDILRDASQKVQTAFARTTTRLKSLF